MFRIVIALKQFRIDHDNGSSYGGSRIVRRVYPDPFYSSCAMIGPI
jgi:sarcosine oxidase/sarcosine oxidase/L-pipecolate oxidase